MDYNGTIVSHRSVYSIRVLESTMKMNLGMGGICTVIVSLCLSCWSGVSGSSEMKYKLYGSILVIGGGLAFPGAASMLQSRLELQLPTLINRSSQTVEVFSNPRVSGCASALDQFHFISTTFANYPRAQASRVM